MIKEFRLSQDESLNVTQKINSNSINFNVEDMATKKLNKNNVEDTATHKLNKNNVEDIATQKLIKKLIKKKKKSSRKLPIAKRGGFLIPLAVGAVSAGSALYNACKNFKNNGKILQEQMRHHKVMEDLLL